MTPPVCSDRLGHAPPPPSRPSSGRTAAGCMAESWTSATHGRRAVREARAEHGADGDDLGAEADLDGCRTADRLPQPFRGLSGPEMCVVDTDARRARGCFAGRMRVIFVCAAGLGHVYPLLPLALLPLARAAVAAGDEVLFVTAGDGAATIKAFGFPAVAVPDGDPSQLAAAWSNLPDRNVNTYVVAD